MNGIFFALVLIAFGAGAWQQWHTPAGAAGVMQALSSAMVDSAKSSVELAIGLVGVMALFLGLMKVAEAGGLLVILARLIRPLMTRLFPDVPPEHPAMGAMVMNISANVMGLGNAATPFGIRAMQELDRLNPVKGTATDAMVLFLAINTSSVTLLPTSVIALRASLGSHDPAAVLPTTLFATLCSTTVAIVAAKLLQNRYPVGDSAATTPVAAVGQDIPAGESAPPLPPAYPPWVSLLVLGGVVAFIPLTILYGSALSPWVLPGLMVAMLGFGWVRKVAVYEQFVEGAREGFDVAVRIIPYLVAILTAVGLFRASGALDWLVTALSPVVASVGMPPETIPMALLRSLSGSGAYGYMASLMEHPATGPDSLSGLIVGTIQGSSETTFYVLAVYFGAVGVRRMRHAIAAGLIGDFVGVLASVVICNLLYTGG
ncbi:MAG: spore maturation protein [Magnetococcus sp. WYHC-3]